MTQDHTGEVAILAGLAGTITGASFFSLLDVFGLARDMSGAVDAAALTFMLCVGLGLWALLIYEE